MEVPTNQGCGCTRVYKGSLNDDLQEACTIFIPLGWIGWVFKPVLIKVLGCFVHEAILDRGFQEEVEELSILEGFVVLKSLCVGGMVSDVFYGQATIFLDQISVGV